MAGRAVPGGWVADGVALGADGVGPAAVAGRGSRLGAAGSGGSGLVRVAAPHRPAVGLAQLVLGALSVSLLAMVVLHLLAVGRLDPLTTTVSDYISIPGGTALLGLAVIGLATATAGLAVGALSTGAHRASALFGFGCAGLLATIAFPTNVIGTPENLDTVLHRYVAAAFFISLPIAALLLRDRATRPITVASMVIGVAFLVSHVPLVFPGWPGAHEIAVVLPRGLAERALLAADMVLIARLAGRVSR
ncbi:MAG TPA: DUF998 domain-containing protein [Pseudonocardiaceae bacterium]|nr:DUF998 domain-containing protein [Pseudonocardiaceae bacterium]